MNCNKTENFYGIFFGQLEFCREKQLKYWVEPANLEIYCCVSVCI